MPGPSLDDLVARSPDAEGAAPRLARFLESGGEDPCGDEARRLLVALCASGSYLPHIITANPAWFAALLQDPFLRAEKPPALFHAGLHAQLNGARDAADLHKTLRVFSRREMLRLGARELGWGTTESVARELSALADACLSAATTFHEQALQAAYGPPTSPEGPSAFVVVGMGKLGGNELNFSSDVDLCYFYSSDDGHAGSLTLHEYYAKLSNAITRALSEPTDEGFVFRVDLRLRPEGRSGPVCNSLWAAERYYETFGRTWERQALLRARPCAGDAALGWQLLKMLEPFVYPRTLGPHAVEDVLALRRLFRDDGRKPGHINIKLDAGGIRDVELVAQLLQLLHGGQRPDLRERGTLAGLRKLWVAGLLSDREQQTLASAYRWFRQIEHRVQLEHGMQTHDIAQAAKHQNVLARRLGFSHAEAFAETLAEQRAAVSAVAHTLGEPQQAPPALVMRLLDPARSADALRADLTTAGFEDVDAAMGALEHVRGRLPADWLTEALRAPDPGRALARFRDLATGGSPGVFALLRDHPQLLRMLANLFGTSLRLSRYLVSQPSRWEPLLADMGAPRPAPDKWPEQLATRLAGLDEEEALREMRRFKTEHLIRIGLHDVAGTLQTEEVSAQLVALAEACLLACVRQVVASLQARLGLPNAELTILGLGSVGAGHMRYGSDLDLVFLYSSEGTTSAGVTHGEWFARLAQRLIGALGAWMDEGKLYEVDTRLRPSGAQGLLVTSYEAFAIYHRDDAALWERAALLRARPLLTLDLQSQSLNHAFADPLRQIVYGHPVDAQALRHELVRMRKRMETERIAPSSQGLHMRLSPGGLTDCEFVAGYGQLLFGAQNLSLQTTNPAHALVALCKAQALPFAHTLLDDERFLSRVALRVRLLRDTPDERIFPSELPFLARTLGLPETDFAQTLDRCMGRVRRCFAQVLCA